RYGLLTNLLLCSAWNADDVTTAKDSPQPQEKPGNRTRFGRERRSGRRDPCSGQTGQPWEEGIVLWPVLLPLAPHQRSTCRWGWHRKAYGGPGLSANGLRKRSATRQRNPGNTSSPLNSSSAPRMMPEPSIRCTRTVWTLGLITQIRRTLAPRYS